MRALTSGFTRGRSPTLKRKREEEECLEDSGDEGQTLTGSGPKHRQEPLRQRGGWRAWPGGQRTVTTDIRRRPDRERGPVPPGRRCMAAGYSCYKDSLILSDRRRPNWIQDRMMKMKTPGGCSSEAALQITRV
ncbi:hypothetical protein INR49_028287 [Caranx melampygus]|nr:hypothetical protein INR49_028287 [Caranx melampygus]